MPRFGLPRVPHCEQDTHRCGIRDDDNGVEPLTGGPGVTRTPDPQFRKLLLYPPELRGLSRADNTQFWRRIRTIIWSEFAPSHARVRRESSSTGECRRL